MIIGLTFYGHVWRGNGSIHTFLLWFSIIFVAFILICNFSCCLATWIKVVSLWEVLGTGTLDSNHWLTGSTVCPHHSMVGRMKYKSKPNPSFFFQVVLLFMSLSATPQPSSVWGHLTLALRQRSVLSKSRLKVDFEDIEPICTRTITVGFDFIG